MSFGGVIGALAPLVCLSAFSGFRAPFAALYWGAHSARRRHRCFCSFRLRWFRVPLQVSPKAGPKGARPWRCR